MAGQGMRSVERALLALVLAALTVLTGAVDAPTALPGAAASGAGATSEVHGTGDLTRVADATAVPGPAVRRAAAGAAVRVTRHGAGGHQASGAGGALALPAGRVLSGVVVAVEPAAAALQDAVPTARWAQPVGRAPPFASGT